MVSRIATCYIRITMKTLNFLLSLAIAVSFGYTQCTGGIFAISSALAAPVNSLEATVESLPMSMEQNFCDAMEEDVKAHASASLGQGGCAGGTCLEESGFLSLYGRLNTNQAYDLPYIPPVGELFAYEYEIPSYFDQQVKPLFADARMHVRSLAKKE